jgi:hypothetical protein
MNLHYAAYWIVLYTVVIFIFYPRANYYFLHQKYAEI